jgi:signal transduction histidine kinase
MHGVSSAFVAEFSIVRYPLQYQIMLPLGAVAAVSLLAVAILNARWATRETQDSIDQQLQGVVRVLSTSSFPLTDTVLRQMRSLSGAEFVLVGENGRPRSASLPALAEKLPSVKPAADIEGMILGPPIELDDKTFFHSAIRLKRQLDLNDDGVLHVLFPRDQYNAAWRGAFLRPLVVGIAAVIALALVAQWIASRISRNLAELGAGVQRLADGDYLPVALPERSDEVRDLAESINQTATRLADYEQHIRQTEQVRTVAMLGAGLAHEMRNAATGCRLAVDLHSENCPHAADDDTLAVAKSQLKLMESRLQRFMQLGRSTPEAHKRVLDLKELIDELLPLVLPAARHAGVNVSWEPGNEPCEITGDSDSLGMVIINLLLNAIEAVHKGRADVAANSSDNVTPADVAIRLEPQDNRFAVLEVSDTGPGLSAEITDSLFRPFVTTKAEGVGLGLAVAQQVAIEHGGEILWSQGQGSTRFKLRLPMAARIAEVSERNALHV